MSLERTSRDWAEGNGHNEYTVIQVPTITLDLLLEKVRVSKIDLLSMDIETGEPGALAGFDIDRYHPELVCIEATAPVRARVVAYFAAHGYERIPLYLAYDQINWYFRPRPAPRP